MSVSDYVAAAPAEAYTNTDPVPGQVIVDLLAALGLEPKHVASVRIVPDVIEIDVWVLDSDGGPAVVRSGAIVNTIRRRIEWAPATVEDPVRRCPHLCHWGECRQPCDSTYARPHEIHRCEAHR